jgi:L-type amino acid transporter 11
MISINKRTPLPAVLLMLPICLIMLASDNVYSLINYLSFAKWLFLGLSAAVLPYMRWKKPDIPRPFKVSLIIPILFILSCLYVVAVSLYSAPWDCGIGLGILLTGVPVYYLCIWWQNKPMWLQNFMVKSTVRLQKLMLVVVQEKETY